MADLFDIAIARKLSGGGGGGSSDFSTAEVTIISTPLPQGGAPGSYTITVPVLLSEPSFEGVLVNRVSVTVEQSRTITMPLYKGKCVLSVNAFTFEGEIGMPSTTGSIELTQQGFLITGDGTIEIPS